MSRLDHVEDLLRAFSARDLDAIRALADAGVELDAPGGGGLTALMRAVLRGDAVAVEWILAAGADPDARGDGGETALDLARELGREPLVELLIAAGAAAARDVEPAPAGPAAEQAPRVAEPASPIPRRRPPRSKPPAPALDRRSDTFGDDIDDRFADRF